MTFIRSLQLSHFRNYDGAQLRPLEPGAIVLYGANGAGKTNILEAVSLLSPGRGLRGAKIGEMQQAGTADGWAVAAEVETRYGMMQVGTGRDPATDKRAVRINGASAKGQNALADILSCVWLTPQMDRLFLDAGSSRRRFFDRLVFAFDPGHAGRVTRYENALSQRAKILRAHDRPDEGWLDALEVQAAETGVAIAAARVDLLHRLQQACDANMDDEDLFPRAQLDLVGTLEGQAAHLPALEIEGRFRDHLRQARQRDGGDTPPHGPHRTDLAVTFAAKNMPAAQCSTGEQKALLIGIVLAHSRLIAAERGAPPILLLDEVAAHLDANRRAGLYRLLRALGGQAWLTGTDRVLFEAMASHAPLIFEVTDGKLVNHTNVGS